jgi:hypothetical protein
MAIEKIGVEIEVKAKNAGKAIKDVTKSLNDFNNSLDKNREGLKVLDQLTGGAVSQFRDFKNSAKGGLTAVKSLANGFKGLKTAILTTGIGAIVIALGLIVAYWDDIKELVSGVSEEQKNLVKNQEKLTAASQEQFEAIGMTENTLKLQGKSEKDILKLKKDQTNETIKNLELQIEAQEDLKRSQKEAAERNQKIAMGIIGFLTAPVTILLKAVDALTSGLEKIGVIDEATNLAEGFLEGAASFVGFDGGKEDEAAANEEIEANKKRLTKLKNQRDGFILKENEDREKSNQEKIDSQKSLDEELEKLRIKNIQDKEKRELAALESERVRTRKALVDKGANDELLLAFDTRYQQRKKEIEDKFQQEKDAKKKVAEDAVAKAEQDFLNSKLERDQLEIQSVNDKYAKLIESANQYGLDTTTLVANQAAEVKAIEDKKAKEDIAREQALKNQKLALVADTFGQIANILGKNSAAGRAAAIAQATINTYQGVTQVWKSESLLPEPLATINRVVSTATVLASGLQAVRKIKSTPKPQGLKSGGSGGGGGGGGASVSPPSFNVVGASGTSQLADAIATQTNEPQRAYVVSGDVTTAQEMERNTISGASI